MKKLLLVSDIYPDDITEGRHLRVNNLARELCKYFDCIFVGLKEKRSKIDIKPDTAFLETIFLGLSPFKERRFSRHFRLTNAHYLERTWPDFFKQSLSSINELVDNYKADCLINFDPGLAEIFVPVGIPRIQDITDSDTLTLERVLSNRGTRGSFRNRASVQLNLTRQLRRECSLVRDYDCITTISSADRKRFLEIAGVRSDKVEVIPNGVQLPPRMDISTNIAEITRSLVFWGNLEFPPNWTAIRYFISEIFLPYLSEADIDFFIAGGGETGFIKDLFDHPRIHYLGFQKDLLQFCVDKAVMVNPMIEGTGLKNKVLESMAMGIPVVSTSMGVEAIQGDTNRHFLVADDKYQFAEEILSLINDKKKRERISTNALNLVREKYSWNVVGKLYKERIDGLLDTLDYKYGSC